MTDSENELPASLTSFVGRRLEIAELKQLLSASRLVTVTGFGGVGKTRVALQTAKQLARAVPDGVWWVDLASLSDPDLLAQTLVDVLDIPEKSARDPEAILVDYLRGRQALLALDNCEHLLDATARLVHALLLGAAETQVLATSRQALGVPGERLLPLAPLAVSEPDGRTDPAATVEYPALELFADRARSVVREFTVTEHNQDAITRICRTLDGIPLAIELAAVRVKVLSVDDLANRLDDRLGVLTHGCRTTEARHQTLRSTIDWSFDLCTPDERMLWARLSVFAGSFDLDAAEQVCADETLPAATILDTITQLVDKSILTRMESAGQIRFRLLETLREYGHERLAASGTVAELRQRHRDWCRELLDEACVQWFGPTQEQWCTRLRLELSNIRAAVEYCLTEPGQQETGLRLLGRPWFLWVALSLGEGRHWLERALKGETHSLDGARALATCAYVVSLQGDSESADKMSQESERIARELDDRVGVAYARHMQGLSALFRDPHRGRALLGDALELYVAQNGKGDLDDLVVGLRVQLGLAHVFLEQTREAVEHFDYCRELCEVVGERWLLSYATYGMAFVDLVEGDHESAAQRARASLVTKRFFRDTLGISVVLDLLAWSLACSGKAQEAAILLGAASAQWKSFGLELFGSEHWLARRRECEERSCQLLGRRAYGKALEHGHSLTFNEMMATALQEHPGKPDVNEAALKELTPREREVAELVAEGLSNKQIAHRLTVSKRTAESHVEHILVKLGCHSRTQIAMWVAKNRERKPQPQEALGFPTGEVTTP